MIQNLAWLNGDKEKKGADGFVSTNPANLDDELGVFGNASAEQVAKAGQIAQEAYQKWKSVPAPVRASVIDNFGRLLEENKEALARVLTREIGKPILEARGDVQEAIDTCNFFVSEGRRLYGMTVPSEMPNKELTTYRRPIGVFACITAGNFPVAVPAWYFVPALVAGNVCVWKAPEDAPLTSYYFAQLLNKAGCPEGVFQVLFGGGADSTGEAIVNAIDDGWINKFGFTGSSLVGQKIGEACGRNLITACLELGGKNPLVVMEDANLELALEGAIWSAYGTAGQRCTSLGNLIIHHSLYDKFVDKLCKKIAAIKVGDPFDESVLYGPMISQKFLDNHLKHLDELVDDHHEILTKKNGRITHKPFDKGLYCYPSLVAHVSADDRIYKTETFGPLFNVMKCLDLDEALDLSNGTGYGLSSAIYTENPAYMHHWKEEIGSGMTSINNSTSGAEAHLPFGGNGRSGNGSRQSGVWVIDQFTRWQAVNWDLSGKLQKAQMDTGYIEADLDWEIDS
jgi:alpha-ketoglutaric semialdehyde dehydrogenase